MASTPFSAVTARTVHLHILPPPRNVGESREVLRALGPFGQVVMFLSSRYQLGSHSPHAATAIFRDADSANRLLAASPLGLSLATQPPTSTDTTDSHSADTKATHTVTAHPSRLNHYAYITQQPFYGGFTPDLSAPIAMHLKGEVPIEALADCSWVEKSREVPFRIRRRWNEERDGRWNGRRTLREMWAEGMARERDKAGELAVEDGVVE